MRLEVSKRFSILLCHGAGSSLHVLGLTNNYFSNSVQKTSRRRPFAINLRGSETAPPPVGRAPRRCRHNTGTGRVSLCSHVPEDSCTGAKLKENDVVADMEAVKNVVVPSLSNRAGHVEAYC